MAIPWLIGGAVAVVGKAIYDGIKEDERREAEERAERQARREAKKRAEKKKKQAEEKAKKEQQAAAKRTIKSFADTKLDNIINEFDLTPQLIKKTEIINSLMNSKHLRKQRDCLINSFIESPPNQKRLDEIISAKNDIEEMTNLFIDKRRR